MIYTYKKGEGNLVKFEPLNKQMKTKIDTAIPIENLWGGIQNMIDPPIDFDTLRGYRYKSETHSAALDFKKRTMFMQGFELLNKENNLDRIRKMMMSANNQNHTLDEIVTDGGVDLIETGNVFFEVVVVGSEVAIYTVDPAIVRARTNKEGTRVDDYVFVNNGMYKAISARRQNKYSYRYIKHVRLPNSLSDIYGMPDYYSCLGSIDINYAIDTWIDSFMDNNARFDFLIVTAGDELDDTSELKLKTALESNKGLENKGKGGYLSVGYDTDVKVIELNKVNHSDFFNGKSEYIQQIIQAHGLSGHSVGFSRGGHSIAGNEAVGALRKDLVTYIQPMQRFYANKLNQMFYEVFGINPMLSFNQMDIVSDKERAVIRDIDFKNGVIGTEYIRRNFYPEMTQEEITDADTQKVDNEQKVNYHEQPDSFDDTQSYERSDRR